MARKTSSAAARARASLQAPRQSDARPGAARSQRDTSAVHSQSGQPTRRRQPPFDLGRWVFTGTVLLVVAIAIVAIARGNGSTTAGVSPGQLNPNNVPLKAGKVAPDFALPAEQGGTYTLSQFRGKVVLLEFFAPWCPHCQAMTSTLRQVATASGTDVQVLAVTASPYGIDGNSAITMHDVKVFVDQYHVNYASLLDVTLKSGNDYGVAGYPQMFMIDRNGAITWGGSGEISYGTLQTQIQKALLVPQATATPHK